MKELMLNHAFRFVERVVFRVGVDNLRSQHALERLGARRTEDIDLQMLQDRVVQHLVYAIGRADWRRQR
jgi:RimJ/RimL family protein N-acetyltransferase